MDINVINECLKSLRTALTNTSVYFDQHPLFVKSVEDLTSKIELVLLQINPWKIMITPDALVIEEQVLGRERLYLDIADYFHRKKIKTLQFNSGINLKELISFLTLVSRISSDAPAKLLLKENGVEHILAEELDYSQFLKGAGDVVDPWEHLLKHNQVKNVENIQEFQENFLAIIKEIKISDLLGDDQLNEHLVRFLVYLKGRDQDSFNQAIEELFSKIIEDRSLIKDMRVDKLKKIFEAIDGRQLSGIFLDEIIGAANFDPRTFDLFARLLDPRQHKEIADLLSDQINKKELFADSPDLVSRLKNLFSFSASPVISEIYRTTVAALAAGGQITTAVIDFNDLNVSYNYLLMNMLCIEDRLDVFELIVNECVSRWTDLAVRENWDYLHNLIDVFEDQRHKYNFAFEAAQIFSKNIALFVETAILDQYPLADWKKYVFRLSGSGYGADKYLDMIFNQKIFSEAILTAYFSLFPAGLEPFLRRLRLEKDNLKFLERVITALKVLEFPAIIKIYEDVFAFGNGYIKLEILRAMRDFKVIDDKFLLELLRSRDVFLKREAVLVLMRNYESRKAAAKLLFENNSWPIIEENISIVEHIELIEAKPYLENIAHLAFFWNAGKRRKAKEVLNKLSVKE